MPAKKNYVQNAPSIVVHGSVASTTRPPNHGVVLWFGTVEPTNMVNGDVYINGDDTGGASDGGYYRSFLTMGS